MPQRCDGTIVRSSRSAYARWRSGSSSSSRRKNSVWSRAVVSDRPQTRVDGEARHPCAAGEPHERAVADDVADARGGDVVGAPDHRRAAAPGRRRSAGGRARRLAQVGGHQHRLEHAGRRELRGRARGPRRRSLGAHREGHRSLPRRRPGGGAGDVGLPALGAAVAGQAARRAATPPRGVASRQSMGVTVDSDEPRSRAHVPCTPACPTPRRASRCCPGPVLAAPYHLRGDAALGALRLRARRQPDVDARSSARSASSTAARRSSSPRAWRP